MTKKLSIFIICLILVTCLFVGCTNGYKQKAITTEFSTAITSNGGLSVVYGKYVYFINGYVGAEGENTFGKAVKGAIVRCELDENNYPKRQTMQTIVPKNVYGTNKNVGIQIIDNYIYYTSPSTTKDKDGKFKVAEMELLRTKVDGTSTQKIKDFSAYTSDFLFTKDYILYNESGELHSINLNSKKFDDTTIDEKITAFKFPSINDTANSMKDIVFYTKASARQEDTHNELFAYKAGQGAKSAAPLITKASYGNSLEHFGGYTLSIVDIAYLDGNKVRLVYDKVDGGPNAKSTGTYSFDFDSTLTFDFTKEVRYSIGNKLSSFYFIDNNNMIVTNGSVLEFLSIDASGKISSSKIIDKSATFFDYKMADGIGNLYYLLSNKIYKLPFLKTATDGKLEINIVGSELVFDATFSSTWLTIDKVGSVIYFLNSNIKDNIYYVDLNKAIERDSKSRIPTLLGNITMEDRVALLS